MQNFRLFFDNTYQRLGETFYENVTPTPLRNSKALIVSAIGLSEIGAHGSSEDPALQAWLKGEGRITGDQQIAQVYAGHQFGVWAGRLGDGRAISLGEILNPEKVRWEVQLKGSGLTPFSRFGDGKAVVRSCIREFLASEALHFLGVPTTRALAVFSGDADVQRERLEKEALCVRLIQSNLRFGTFEWFASQGDLVALGKLEKYCREILFKNEEPRELFQEITCRTARMVAHWQAVGFCHGVMNTDNMSILGVTLDFGPFGFMEQTDFEHVCNHSDSHGRYRYSQQPAIALWNLKRLGLVFEYLYNDKKIDFTTELPNLFETVFRETYFQLMGEKLGVERPQSEPFQSLLQELLHTMQTRGMDWTHTFRKLIEGDSRVADLLGPAWIKAYETLRTQNGKAPIYVLKNSVAEQAIRAVEDHNDNSLLTQIFQVLQNPYQHQPGFEGWSEPRKPTDPDLVVSCSS